MAGSGRWIRMRRPLAAWSLLFAALSPAAAENYAQWAHTSDVFLNTLPDGANVTSEVRHFPVLIRLDGSNFAFSEALGKGQDIRFTDSNGVRLPHQIESWDSAAGRADVWVRIDTVHGGSADQSFKMLW